MSERLSMGGAWDRRGAHIRLHALLFAAISACAHAPTGAAQLPLHQRVVTRADLHHGVWVAELQAHGDEAELRFARLDGCGEAGAVEAEPEQAAHAAAAVRAGETLESRVGAEPFPWSEAFSLSGGLRVESVRRADRYGPFREVRLVGADGVRVELLRAPADSRVLLAAAPGGLVVARVEGPGTLRDVRIASLDAGRARLEIQRGEAALAAGRADDALRHANRARRRAPEPPPWTCHEEAGAAAFLEARALRAVGAAEEQVLEALAAAIAVDPSRYRMFARTEELFAGLREDPRFRALVEPRALEGSATAP